MAKTEAIIAALELCEELLKNCQPAGDGTKQALSYVRDAITEMTLHHRRLNPRKNPYLVESAYGAQLQALPEPIRTQLLRGDF